MKDFITSCERQAKEHRPHSFSTLIDALDPGFPVICATRGFYDFTGYTEAETLGQSSFFLDGEKTDSGATDSIREAMNQRTGVSASVLQYRKNGTPFFSYVNVRPVLDSDEAVYRFSKCHTPICEHSAHLQTVFGFTLTEMLVAETLCKGATLYETAETFGVLRQAIRVHFLNVITKTGIAFGEIRGAHTKIGTKHQRALVSELNDTFNDAQALASSVRPNAVPGEMLAFDSRGKRLAEPTSEFSWLSGLAA